MAGYWDQPHVRELVAKWFAHVADKETEGTETLEPPC